MPGYAATVKVLGTVSGGWLNQKRSSIYIEISWLWWNEPWTDDVGTFKKALLGIWFGTIWSPQPFLIIGTFPSDLDLHGSAMSDQLGESCVGLWRMECFSGHYRYVFFWCFAGGQSWNILTLRVAWHLPGLCIQLWSVFLLHISFRDYVGLKD